jgi:hypothetical protein
MNIFTLLQVVFITLKVMNIIDWSWWMVFVPTYISIVIVIVVFIGYGMLDQTFFRDIFKSKKK